MGLHQDWGGPFLDYFVCALATLLLPIKQREEFLVALNVPIPTTGGEGERHRWTFVEEDLEEVKIPLIKRTTFDILFVQNSWNLDTSLFRTRVSWLERCHEYRVVRRAFHYLTFDLPGRRGEYDASERIGLYLLLWSVSFYRPLPTYTPDWSRWYVYMMDTSIGRHTLFVYF